jgi:hypothetical protein
MALAPGNARVLRDYGEFAVSMGHTDAGIAAARRAVALDPLTNDPGARWFRSILMATFAGLKRACRSSLGVYRGLTT